MNSDLNFKVVIIGNSQVGKTSIIQRAKDCSFEENSAPPTLQGNATKIPVKVEGKTVTIEMWDTAGTEAYQALAVNYARNAVACICVFDMTSEDSFNDLSGWVNMMQGVETIKYLYFVGNKSDLIPSDQPYDQTGLQELCNKYGGAPFLVSALTGSQIEELFQAIAEQLYKDSAITQKSTQQMPTPRKETDPQSSCCKL